MPESTSTRIVIVGAGPCGLACGRELRALGHEGWTIFERAGEAGGHAGSVVDPEGFTWDQGGHVVFSHYGEFDRLLEEALGDDVHEHERSSYVRLDGRWIPYPFQNNLRYLGPEDAYDCLVGLIDAAQSNGTKNPAGGESFAAWMEATFGEGITRLFMRPYNLKVWATPAERMSASWIAERVSVVDHKRALKSILLGLDDVGWGPNNTFRFPRSGGTGEIYRRVAGRLGEKVRYDAELVGLDTEKTRDAPDGERGERDQDEALGPEIAARQHGSELVLASTQQLFEVRRRRTGRLRSRPPRPLRSGTPGATALITPWHECPPRSACGRIGICFAARVIGDAKAPYNARSCRG